MLERKGRPCKMAQEEEAMEDGNCKAAQGLSWRSRNTGWWSSAVDLSSTLLSKMDQVPASLGGFTLPWHAGARGDQSKALQSPQEFPANQPVELPEPRNEIAKPALEGEPLEIPKPPLDCEPAVVVDSPKGRTEEEGSNSPKGDTAAEETRSTPRGAESRRRTKRMPVELAPAGPNQDDDADAPIRSKKLSAVGQEILLGEGQGTTRVYADEMRQLCRHRKQLSEAAVRRVDNASVFSSRRSCHSSQSWSRLEETIKNNPPHALPVPPSDSNVTRTEESLLPGDSNPDLKPIRLCELGGSSRVTREPPVVRKALSASLPASPRLGKESRGAKLFRTLGISSTRAANGNEIVVSKKLAKQKGLQVVNNLIVSQHQKFAKSLEPRKLGITNGVRNHQEGNKAAALVEHSRKKSSSSRWLFKWIWGSSSKPAAPKLTIATPQRGEAPPQDAKPMRHKRTSSWGCASHASTAVITPLRRSRIHQDDNDATENMVESRVDCDVRESYQDCQGSIENSGSFRSQESFRKSEVFEDCHGSFRSVTSCASFRSVDIPDETEWGLPPPLQADQTLTIGDVAALCNSSLKFVFKCREIQHFNKFLRSQKKRLLNAKGNTDCFNVILSGTDIEVSSMVAAMAYAWFLVYTVPKVSGKTWHAVAMIDIPRHQMHKHKDAAWLFDACGIDPAALLFADEMELASLVGAGRIKISTIGQDVLVTRNEVGSVCTLLGEKLVAEAQCLLEPRYMKTLLLAGVLLDTENLDFASTRDTEITTTLLVGSGSLGRNGFFDQLRDVEDDDQVSKVITRSYGDAKQLSSRKMSSPAQAKMQQEADQEQSDKDSLFTQSRDQTSTSEAGTSSSLDEDSPRLKQRSSFKCTKLPSRSAPARSHQLQSPSNTGCKEDEKAVAHLRKAAAAQFISSSCGTRSSNFPRIRKKLILYQV